MSYTADLHIHSPFSRATSKKSDLPGLLAWARVKGINLVGTGDFTHPGWLSHLKTNLVEAEPGFFRLKDENVPPAFDEGRPEATRVRFVLTSEISSIYKRGGRVRKIHNILMVPDFRAVERINRRLASIGNIESDGRPIIGLDSRDLLEILLEESPEGFLVPAHIWTPWFSLFGSKSGFDTIEECFGDLSEHIFALETGLSSDPAMNRHISALDNYTLISNSDCHSPAKLGREVNIFSCREDFFSMREAIKNPALGFEGTIEFFPEEGKYHLDGHRKCGVSFNPLETKAADNICPVCGSPLTIGVNHRIMDLADRSAPVYPENDPFYKSLVPLMEVISEIIGVGPGSKRVLSHYRQLINSYGSEFNVLLNTPLDDLKNSLPLLDEAIRRIRNNQVIRKAGYDGQFGVITVFEKDELQRFKGQASLFEKKRKSIPSEKKKEATQPVSPVVTKPRTEEQPKVSAFLPNPDQGKAITSSHRRILVTAGPGTGKTYTLISRLIYLLEKRQVRPEEIVAITFTNRAAGEIRERLISTVGDKADRVTISTFHSFCLGRLKEEREVTVIGEEERDLLLKKILPDLSNRDRRLMSLRIADSLTLGGLAGEQPEEDRELLQIREEYREALRATGALDLEEIIPGFLDELRLKQNSGEEVLKDVNYLLVDEFQDVDQSQYELTEFIARRAETFVIGDPDQAIYGFRGSDLNLFFRFAEDSSTEVLKLKDNYRSAPPVVTAAAGLISRNRLKSGVRLTPHAAGDTPLTFCMAPSPRAEAEYVVGEIEKLIGGVSSYSINTGRSGKGESSWSFRDIAILYRLSRQADSLVEALERRGLPFQLIGVRPFFKKADIRAAYYWILCAAGEAKRAEYLALCRETPGLGVTTLNRLEETVPLESTNFFDDARKTDLPERVRIILDSMALELNRFRENNETSLEERLQDAFRFLQIDTLSDNAVRLRELATALGTLSGLTIHLRENSLATIYNEKAEAISLMTLHSAKGLEFPVVFIVGCQEGHLPHLVRGSDLEEERRLFYVGLTRAREALYLSCSGGRQVSRFIDELPQHLLERTELQRKTEKCDNIVRQLSLF